MVQWLGLNPFTAMLPQIMALSGPADHRGSSALCSLIFYG